MDVQQARGRGRDVVLQPTPPPTGLRVSGPGRIERGYRQRVRELELEVDRRANALSILRREVQISGLVERGTGRLADRLEGEVERARRHTNRMLVTLGALQRENEGLRAELDASRARLALLDTRSAATHSAPWWRRWLGRGAPPA